LSWIRVLWGLVRSALGLVSVRRYSLYLPGQTAADPGGDSAEVPRGTTIKRHWPSQQASAVGLWHVNEKPIVVMVLFVEHANAFSLARAGNTEDWPAPESWSVETGIGICT
jgi:hypothetical protein